ncbi:MAG: LPS assembly protein LptD [Pseudomonadota bacterium]
MQRLLCLLVFLLWPFATVAQETEGEQEPALLIADEIIITSDRNLLARGNVEAFQGALRLKANAIRYNRETGALSIEGPIYIQDAEGVTILADAGELDSNLRSGLLLGARMVLDERLQLSAVQVQRVNDRYSQLYRTVATSCQVCEDGRPPLWQIRARRVVHDRETRQLYFDDAQFRIRSVPVFYLPRLRLPDPTVDRQTGFLPPSIVNTSEFGTGIQVPYFVTLGDSRDITLSPYISPRTTTLNLRYRQAFRKGRIEFEGALSRDEERRDATRAYLFGSGGFSLPNDFSLGFGLEIVSDESYLQDYDITNADRLTSFVGVARTDREEYISAALINYESLRNFEENDLLPTIVGDGVYRARYFPAVVGGEVSLLANAHAHYRTSDLDVLGRDLNRFNVETDWFRTWTLTGVRTEASVGAAADFFDIAQDSTVPDTQSQLSPRASLTMRYPLSKQADDGASLVLEPLFQLGWVGGERLDNPNEESTSVEFDAGNLLSLSRFPAPDRRERGFVAAYGVNWTRYAASGWEAGATFGQLVRDEADFDFSENSGLAGTSSDFLLAGQFDTGAGFTLSARTLFSEDLDFTKAEFRGSYRRNRLGLSGTYLWLTEEIGEELTPTQISELALAGTYNVNRNWFANFDWRYDLEFDRASEIGAGLSYTNECVTTTFGFDRTFSTSSSLEPSTTFSVTIGVRGFSARSGTETYSRSCGT